MFILRYFIKCHECGAEQLLHEQRLYELPSYEKPLKFIPPDGWKEGARDCYYCQKHVVVVAVTVDGKPA